MKAANGFTLVEILAALFAGSLLLSALAWTTMSLAREFRASQEAAKDALGAITPVVQSLIEQAAPPTPDADPTIAQSESLEILTAAPRALGDAGLVRAIFSVRNAADGESLTVRFAPHDPSPQFPPAALAETQLAGGYEDITFAYEKDTSSDGTAPLKLVTINFERRDGSTGRIVAAPQINSSGNCRFDPISLSCRP